MNRRIETIAGLVREGKILADIGTDHAWLPVLLVKAGKIPFAYACDVSRGPLQAAEANIEKNGLSDRIVTVLSDGFENVPDDAECAVIAGMGYYTAVHILEEAGKRLDRLDQILVQVNTDVPLLRRWISDHGYTIDLEKTVSDRGRFYTAVSFTTVPHAPYDELEILCGPYLLTHPDETSKAFIRENIRKLGSILEKSGGNPKKKQEHQMWQEALQISENQKTTAEVQ